MKSTVQVIVLLLTLQLWSCNSKKNNDSENQKADVTSEQVAAKEAPANLQNMKRAYFASGCFWCVEAIFESVKGVGEVYSGYAGGSEKNPTYEEVSYGKTSHAEAVEVLYDPQVVSFETLVRVFFGSHDPTTLNQQGPDKGAQYRSIAFYTSEEEKEIIERYIAQLEREKLFRRPIVTEIKSLDKFWMAEDYHQDYERLNPNNPYIKNVSIPRLRKFQSMYPELLKENTTGQDH